METNEQSPTVLNVTANTTVHHAQLSDIKNYTPEKLDHLQRGGIRTGPQRVEAQTQQMLDKIPPAQRAGIDGRSAASKVKEYLADKDASHITPHSKGGSNHPDNLKWEVRSANRARGNQPMTRQEQRQLNVKAQVDNFTGALKAGIEAAPKGAVIGVITTAPFSMLRNALRVVRGEITAQDAATEALKEVAIGGGVGAATACLVTTVATACPPIAVALTAVSPVLLAAGGVGMIYEFFKILGDHKQQVKDYYESLTEQELKYLQQVESELVHEHERNLAFIADSKEFSDELIHRPYATDLEGALSRYAESLSIAKSLNTRQENFRLPGNSQ